MDELRVLHAADLHVDSPMLGLVAYEGAPLDEVRGATRAAMRALVDEALERAVHLVVVAGDLYDGSWRDYNTGLFVVQQLARLHEAGIPVVLVLGNHDAESQLTRRLRLPPNTTVLASSKPETTVLDGLGVAVHGQSYARRSVEEDLSLAYPEPDPGLVNIGLLHTCLDGSLGHHPYAPCTVTGLRAKRYDYWALGHVHDHHVVADDPHVVFPGNLQGRHARETGPKGATLATFRGREVALERLVFGVVRWERCQVDLGGARTVDDCLERCRSQLEERCRPGPACYAVRVELVGETALNGRLRSQPEPLLNDVRALALALGGGVFVEKVVVATTAGGSRSGGAGEGVAGEVARVVEALRPELSGLAADEAGPLAPLASLRAPLRGAGGVGRQRGLDDDELDASTAALARRLADGPFFAYAQTKALLSRELDMPLSAAIELEAMTQALLMNSADHAEFHAAFNEKRPPAWQGR